MRGRGLPTVLPDGACDAAEVHEAWTSEIKPRVDEVINGRVKMIPRDEARAQTRGRSSRTSALTHAVSYHPEATAELCAEVALYEERRVGLGDRFEASVDSLIDEVLECRVCQLDSCACSYAPTLHEAVRHAHRCTPAPLAA